MNNRCICKKYKICYCPFNILVYHLKSEGMISDYVYSIFERKYEMEKEREYKQLKRIYLEPQKFEQLLREGLISEHKYGKFIEKYKKEKMIKDKLVKEEQLQTLNETILYWENQSSYLPKETRKSLIKMDEKKILQNQRKEKQKNSQNKRKKERYNKRYVI